MESFIRSESDMSARRNAFLMLFNGAEHIAIEYLTEQADNITKFGDSFALLALELSRKVCNYLDIYIIYSRELSCVYTFLYLYRLVAEILLRKLDS